MTEILACIALNPVIDSKDFSYMIYVMDREYLRLLSEKRKEQEHREKDKDSRVKRNH